MPNLLKPNLIYQRGFKGHLYTRVHDLDNYDNIDILFLGSSHAYRGFDPRIFEEAGFTAFNLGSSGQTPINGQVLLERYLDELNPKLVIYEVFAGTLHGDGVESSLDIISNDRNDWESMKMAWSIHHLKTYNTLIYGFFRNILHLDDGFKEPRKKGGEEYINGGYVERDNDYFKSMSFDARRWDWNPKQLKALRENMELLKSKGIPVLLVNAPTTKALNESFENAGELDSILNSYGEYYNFFGKVDLVDSLHFYDAHHLNHEGVKLFNQKLLQEIPLRDKMRIDHAE